MVLHSVGSSGICSQLECFPDMTAEPQSCPLTSRHSSMCERLHAASTQGSKNIHWPRACWAWSEGRSETQSHYHPWSSPTQWWIVRVDQYPICFASQVEPFWGIFYTISHCLLRDLTSSPTEVTSFLMYPILAFFNSPSHFLPPCQRLLW